MRPVSKLWAVRKPWEAAVPVGQANRRRASESLDDVPQDLRLPSYPPVGPTDRLSDLYGSLSALLGMSLEGRFRHRNGTEILYRAIGLPVLDIRDRLTHVVCATCGNAV